jgi:uncharacterized protein YbbK (DUF523 family)
MYIVSACLAGENCRYNGGNNEVQWVLDFTRKHRSFLVCPEILGGLPVPRPPCEIKGGRAIDIDGRDVTEALEEGAARSWLAAERAAKDLNVDIEGAILKENSPSCGRGKIYDGTFRGNLVDGDGFFAGLLKSKGVKVTTEMEIVK